MHRWRHTVVHEQGTSQSVTNTMQTMSQVVPGLYIGDQASVQKTDDLLAARVRYLLTVYEGAPPTFPDLITNHMRVPVTDDTSSDLLSWLDRTNAFIQQGMDEGAAVLVHCVSGVSRSATVVMAYIMTSQQLPCPKAFRILKKAHRPSCPNEGFRNQLKMFEAMEYKLDPDNPEYRLYKLQYAVDTNMGSLGEIPLAPAPTRQTRDYQMMLQCRKCRFRAAVDRNVMDHEPGAGQVAFQWRRRDLAEVTEHASPRCSSVFIEPMEWMAPLVEEGHLQGKLCCPQCTSRWGNYNWAGLQCSCGCWVTPAFQINVSRIDCMPPPALPESAKTIGAGATVGATLMAAHSGQAT